MVSKTTDGKLLFYEFERNDFRIQILERKIQKKSQRILPDFHKDMEIFICTKGKCNFLINNEVYNFNENTVLIIYPYEVHCILSNPEDKIDYILLFFDHKSSCLIKSKIEELNSIHTIHLNDKNMVFCNMLLNSASDDIANKRCDWKETAINSLERVLIILNRAKNSEDNKSVNHSNGLIDNVVLYIDNHFAEPLTLKDISEQFIINPDSLSRLMREYIGTTFKPYLTHRRIIESCKYLENTDSKIGVIAFQVGFDEISSLNRNFMKLIGTTPSNYRKLKEKSNNR